MTGLVGIIKFKTLPKILKRKMCNFGEMDRNLLQNIKVVCSIFRLEGGILNHKGSMGVPVCFSDKLEKLLSKTQENWAIFQF